MLCEHALAAIFPPQFLADEKPRNGPDPRAEIRATLKGLQLLKRHDERLLRHIIRRFGPQPQAAHKHPQPRLLAADLLDEPIMIWKRGTHTGLHPRPRARYEVFEKM